MAKGLTRRESRELAFSVIFGSEFSDNSHEDVIDAAIEAGEYKESDFSLWLINGVFDNLDEIDSVIEECSVGWKKSRISRVSLALLRLAVFELLRADDIPVSVSINEAVELAKKYGGDDDPAFINGVLGAVVRSRGIDKSDADKRPDPKEPTGAVGDE